MLQTKKGSSYLECYHIKFPVLVSTRNMGNTCTTPRDKYCPNCRLIIKVAGKATQTDPGPPPPRMRDTACNTKVGQKNFFFYF